MNKDFSTVTVIIITVILIAVVIIEEYRIEAIKSTPTTATIVHDTVTVTSPIPVSVAETRQVRAKLPVVELPVIELSIVDSLSAVADSAEVIIPISTKVYEDSLYRAVISGYNASLDSMQIYRQTVYVDRTKIVRPKRWSIGVQVGYGTDFRGLRPYIGVGIGYRLFDY